MIRKLLPIFFLLLTVPGVLLAGDKHATGIGDTPPKNWMTFDQLDDNHDGRVTADEFRAAQEKIAQERFSKSDLDGDGRISEKEFTIGRHRFAAKDEKSPEARRNIKRESEFSACDKDGSGGLNRDEYDAATLETASTRFDQIDRNNDNLITRDELDAALTAVEAAHDDPPARRKADAAASKRAAR